ncbi:MAG: hypothetical protein ABI576_00975 [Flavobacterium sp.]
MKVKIKKIFIFLLIPLYMACQKKDNNSTIVEKESNKFMEEVLVSQLKNGSKKYYKDAGIELPNDQIDFQDIKATVEICKKILTGSGFISLSNEKFNSKCKLIFNRVIDPNSDKNFLYINYFDKCDKKINFYPNNGIDYQGAYIIKNENFITEFFYIPELIDYKNEFPKASESENNVLKSYKNKDGEEITVELWKDVENNKDLAYSIKDQRKKNSETLINRNKYLFNDSKASLVWLKFNDQEFLESLVKTFGYVEDQDLLKWVLNRNLKEEEFDKILFTKACDNKYVFHKEIFEIMNQADKSNKEKYLVFLKEHFPKVDKNNFSDETKIQALYCYYSTKFSGSIDILDVYSFFPRLNDEESEEEFKKNNYYNLSDFKELYKETRYGAGWQPGMKE